MESGFRGPREFRARGGERGGGGQSRYNGRGGGGHGRARRGMLSETMAHVSREMDELNLGDQRSYGRGGGGGGSRGYRGGGGEFRFNGDRSPRGGSYNDEARGGYRGGGRGGRGGYESTREGGEQRHGERREQPYQVRSPPRQGFQQQSTQMDAVQQGGGYRNGGRGGYRGGGRGGRGGYESRRREGEGYGERRESPPRQQQVRSSEAFEQGGGHNDEARGRYRGGGRGGRGRGGYEDRRGGREDNDAPRQQSYQARSPPRQHFQQQVMPSEPLEQGGESTDSGRLQQQTRSPPKQDVPHRSMQSDALAQVSQAMGALSVSENVRPTQGGLVSQPIDESYNVAPRPAPATRVGKQVVELLTNAYELKFDPNARVYRYDVNVQLEAVEVVGDGVNKTRMISLNKGPRDDASQFERHELIRLAVRRGLEMYRILNEAGAFENGANMVAHDGAALLYANGTLEGSLKKHGGTITITVNDLPVAARANIRNQNVERIAISIAPCQDGGDSFLLGDLQGQMTSDRSAIDNSLKQFYEIITSAQAINEGNFSFFSGGRLYKADPNARNKPNRFGWNIGHGMERIPGITKGYSLVEGDGRGGGGRGGGGGHSGKGEGMSRAVAALIIDPTIGTFWKAGDLMCTVCEINGGVRPVDLEWTPEKIHKTEELLKNLRVTYNPPSGGSRFDFTIKGLATKPIHELVEFNADGEEISTLSKFADHHTIEFRDWPCVVLKRAQRHLDNDNGKPRYTKEYFPIEFLHVLPHQRVCISKQQAQPVGAERPSERVRNTSEMLDALNLMGKPQKKPNPWMEAFGISLEASPLKAEAIIRAKPSLSYGRGMAEITDTASWRTGNLNFEIGAQIELLAVSFIQIPVPMRQRLFHSPAEEWAGKLTENLVRNARKKGIKIADVKITNLDIAKLPAHMKEISDYREKNGLNPRKVVLVLIEPEESKHHKELKLLERKYLLPTMHLTTEVAGKLGQKSVTENVLAKLNIKAGGHNYSVMSEKFAHDLWISEGNRTMIVGYDVWHPTGQSRRDIMRGIEQAEPSCVGFAFNGGVKADAFVGDYHYQERRREQVHPDVLVMRIKWMLGIFEKERGTLPDVIIVTRDGVSDGQFRHAIDELASLREGAEEYARSDDRKNKTGQGPTAGYAPKFIFIVATKRHHRRFYEEKFFGNQRSITNAPALAVVDNTVTAPNLNEFFVQAHTPLQGTAKMTRYIILKDDVGVSSDAIQSIMMALCFEHQISANAISIPEPVYQADRWAQRGATNYRAYMDMYAKGREESFEVMTKKLAYMGSPLEALRTNA